jgi:membrane-bound ClpP family serine protease
VSVLLLLCECSVVAVVLGVVAVVFGVIAEVFGTVAFVLGAVVRFSKNTLVPTKKNRNYFNFKAF